MAENNTGNSSAHLSPEDYEETYEEAAPVSQDSAASPYSYSDVPQTADAQSVLPSNDYGLTLPVAPEGGTPAYPGATAWSPTVITFPVFPSCPGCSSCTNCNFPQNNAQVRFLNASANTFPVNVSIDNTNYAVNARFGTISGYGQLADGFHTVTVRRASGLQTVLLQQTFPFTGGQKYTLVLVDTASGGLAMSQVSDSGCSNMNYNTGCYRVANMSYSGSGYDVMLYSHDAVFRNVDFREVTIYKQAMAGSYQFYITNAGTFSVIRELPMIVIGAVSAGSLTGEPLVSYQLNISAGARYTSYLIGNNWSDMGFRALTVTD